MSQSTINTKEEELEKKLSEIQLKRSEGDSVALAKKFISIPSIKGNSRALKEVLDAALAEVKGYRVDFFEKEGGPAEDFHNLDRDGDGIVCESLK